MAIDTSPLFEPLEIKGHRLRNRIVMPPMVALRGIATPEGIEWYGEHARGGVSMVVVEATAVNRFGTELTADSLAPLVNAIHAGGALATIQLFPVTFEFPRTGPMPAPADLTLQQVKQIVSEYSAAAAICAAAGFDGIEPHGAHGYLINQFFSPEQNGRRDHYGGSLENRMRFARRIVEAVRPHCTSGMLLLYRHTPVGKGYGMDASLELAGALVEGGVDVLDISPSSINAPGDRAEPFRRFGVPVIAVNQLDDVERALEALVRERTDLVAVGRGLIADPEWPNKVSDGRLDDILRCERCDEKCFGNLRLGLPIGCTQWPASG